ncbi:hypothetical protein FRC98_12950 [Lujinxingia vulgaris]|uniref:Uncharacterized protein n=1 Tax=Lujinxingia vulgaris TaxID=2600176 RepID=A0A5C6XHM8_9DELT|nr:hypothetical protein [Lujinxingia vulgaris]TXD36728.1 hypothetical protein FRC98_12950 [Lujinxingia vulgaris]
MKRIMIVMLAAAWITGCSSDSPDPTPIAEPDAGDISDVSEDADVDEEADVADAEDEDTAADEDAADVTEEDTGNDDDDELPSDSVRFWGEDVRYAYRLGEEVASLEEVFLLVDAKLENISADPGVGMALEDLELQISTTEGDVWVEAMALGAELEGGCASGTPAEIAATGEESICTVAFRISPDTTATFLRYTNPRIFGGKMAAISMPLDGPVTETMLQEVRETYAQRVVTSLEASCACDSEPFSSEQECVDALVHDMSGCDEVVLRDRGAMYETIECLNAFTLMEANCYETCGEAQSCVDTLGFESCWEILDEPLRTELRGC